jgi:hypothetical protein
MRAAITLIRAGSATWIERGLSAVSAVPATGVKRRQPHQRRMYAGARPARHRYCKQFIVDHCAVDYHLGDPQLIMWETSHCDAWGIRVLEKSAAAERMRRYRKRQRRGQRIVRVQIGPTEIEALVLRGFIGPGDRKDPIAIEYGLSVLIDQALGDS